MRTDGVDFDAFDAVTFDCYGTLIDWETGLAAALRGALDPLGVTAADEELISRYARHEAEAEAGPYLTYREVLAAGLRGVAASSASRRTPARWRRSRAPSRTGRRSRTRRPRSRS